MSTPMSPPELPWDGGCRCDRLRIRVTTPPLLSVACHCPGCQRMSSSAFSLTLLVPNAGLEVLAGEPVVGGLKGEDIEHSFCGECMTWVFTRPRGYDFVNLRPSMLDERAWFAPFAETYASTKLPWVDTGAQLSFPEFPAPDAWGEALGAYATWASARGWPV